MRITLIRHGRPKFQLKGCLKAENLASIARRYDSSGIVDTPPSATIEAISGHDIAVCSHLTRSQESANALGIRDIELCDPLFAETLIPHFDRGSIAMPIGFWIVLLRLFWLLGYSKNGESVFNARSRAQRAADKLINLADGGKHVVLIGHGLFNYMIANALLKNGWTGPSRPGSDYWGFGVYKPAMVC
jgi:broad specificity phosphatase PhoE